MSIGSSDIVIIGEGYADVDLALLYSQGVGGGVLLIGDNPDVAHQRPRLRAPATHTPLRNSRQFL